MKLDTINQTLEQEPPSRLILQRYDAGTRELSVAFTFDGGPYEDSAYVVNFRGVAIVHLPSILHESNRLRLASMTEAKFLVPTCSFDPEELSGKNRGYSVCLICDDTLSSTGYYVVAEAVSASWVPKEKCVNAF